jgi:hypothetical protein
VREGERWGRGCSARYVVRKIGTLRGRVSEGEEESSLYLQKRPTTLSKETYFSVKRDLYIPGTQRGRVSEW